MGSLTNELDAIMAKEEQILAETANEMLSVAKKQSPVGNPSLWKVNQIRTDGKIWRPAGYSGGTLRKSWELNRTANGWSVFNPMLYASIAMAEHIPSGKNAQGSSQFPLGIDPFIRNINRKLQNKLNAIR